MLEKKYNSSDGYCPFNSDENLRWTEFDNNFEPDSSDTSETNDNNPIIIINTDSNNQTTPQQVPSDMDNNSQTLMNQASPISQPTPSTEPVALTQELNSNSSPVNQDWEKYPNTNCNSGYNYSAIDLRKAGDNLDLEKCKMVCVDDPDCNCIVHNDTSCFLRNNCNTHICESGKNVDFNTYIHNPSFPSRTPLIKDTTIKDTSIKEAPIKEAPIALKTTPEVELKIEKSVSKGKPYKLIDEHSDKNIFEPDEKLGSGYISGCPLSNVSSLNTGSVLDVLSSDNDRRYLLTEETDWIKSPEKINKYNKHIYVGGSRGSSKEGIKFENSGVGGPAKCSQAGDLYSNMSNPCKMIIKNQEYEGDEDFDCSKFYYYRPSGAEGWGFILVKIIYYLIHAIYLILEDSFKY